MKIINHLLITVINLVMLPTSEDRLSQQIPLQKHLTSRFSKDQVAAIVTPFFGWLFSIINNLPSLAGDHWV